MALGIPPYNGQTNSNNCRYISTNTLFSNWYGSRVDDTSLASIRYDARKIGLSQSFSTVQLRTFNIATMYNIIDWSAQGSLKNNELSFTWVSTPYTITIDDASYDGYSLASKIEALMNSATSSSNFTVSYDINSSKFTFISASGNLILNFDSNSPWFEIGFSNNTNYSGTTITAPYASNLTWSTYILININEFNAQQINMIGNSPSTFAIQVDNVGNWVNSFSYLISGPSHVSDQGLEKQISEFSINLRFMRAGKVYDLVGDANTTYTISLMFTSHRTV